MTGMDLEPSLAKSKGLVFFPYKMFFLGVCEPFFKHCREYKELVTADFPPEAYLLSDITSLAGKETAIRSSVSQRRPFGSGGGHGHFRIRSVVTITISLWVVRTWEIANMVFLMWYHFVISITCLADRMDRISPL